RNRIATSQAGSPYLCPPRQLGDRARHQISDGRLHSVDGNGESQWPCPAGGNGAVDHDAHRLPEAIEEWPTDTVRLWREIDGQVAAGAGARREHGGRGRRAV